jgi:mediator of RNA polymerase II transcription subunit 23
MFMDTPEDEKTKLISCLGAFRQFWAGLSQVSTACLIQSADDFWPFIFLHLL